MAVWWTVSLNVSAVSAYTLVKTSVNYTFFTNCLILFSEADP